MTCYRDGGCGPYENLACTECPASKPEYATKHKRQTKHSEQFDAFFENKDTIKRIINTVDCHAISFDDVAKIIEACAPYCDEKTVDGFIMWFQSWWKAKMPKKVVEDKNGVYCPDCHEILADGHGDAIVLYGEKQQRFCPNCGRMVEWD